MGGVVLAAVAKPASQRVRSVGVKRRYCSWLHPTVLRRKPRRSLCISAPGDGPGATRAPMIADPGEREAALVAAPGVGAREGGRADCGGADRGCAGAAGRSRASRAASVGRLDARRVCGVVAPWGRSAGRTISINSERASSTRVRTGTAERTPSHPSAITCTAIDAAAATVRLRLVCTTAAISSDLDVAVWLNDGRRGIARRDVSRRPQRPMMSTRRGSP